MTRADHHSAYRSRDEGGSPETCGAVAQAWIDQHADEARQLYAPESLRIEMYNVFGGGSVTVLYHRTRPIAVATIFRDDMNFSQLVRWVA